MDYDRIMMLGAFAAMSGNAPICGPCICICNNREVRAPDKEEANSIYS
jgi:hypothetical protein